MRRAVSVIFVVFWSAILTGLGVYYAFVAPRDSVYSEEENRMLAAMPALTAESVREKEFGDAFESYLLDRFPDRNRVISGTAELKNILSIASYEEYLMIAESARDPLDSKVNEEELDALLGERGNGQQEPGQNPAGGAGVGQASGQNPAGGAGTEQNSGDSSGEDGTGSHGFGDNEVAGGQPPVEQLPENKEEPPIEKKPEAMEEDFPEILGVYAETGETSRRYLGYSRKSVLALTAVLDRYAGLLPENGKLMFTMVPQSIYGNQFVNASGKERFYSDFSDVINAFGADNVYSFDAAGILSDAILRGEYVYFRTDMHWTPYGSYLVYREMAARAGKMPCDYEEDFTHTTEEPFLGTYYRDNPSSYMKENADSLEILMPKSPLEWRRITAKDEYKLIDFLNFDARKNDRYTVYLGGPAGPWTYAESENEEKENCLVITDSFGLGFIPFVVTNYRQVHYYDPRYFDKAVVGYSVAEMIEKYEIQDIYVVIGDLHSFDSSFLLGNALSQLEAGQ